MIAQGKTRSVAALGLAHKSSSSPEPERSGDGPPTGGPAGVTEGNQRANEAGHPNSNSLEFEGFNCGGFATIGGSTYRRNP